MRLATFALTALALAVGSAATARAHDGSHWYWSADKAEATLETARWPDHREVDLARCVGRGAPYKALYKHFRCKLDARVRDAAAIAEAREELNAAIRFGDPRLISDAEDELNYLLEHPRKRLTQYVTLDEWMRGFRCA